MMNLKDMERMMADAMEGVINKLIEDGVADDQILAIIRSAQAKADDMEDAHISLLYDMVGEEAVVDIVVSGTQMHTDLVFNK